MQHLDYLKVPNVLIKDDRLSDRELGQLIRLFSKIEITKLLNKTKWLIDKEIISDFELLDSLFTKGWLDKEDVNIFLTIPDKLISKNLENKENEYDEKGSKIASNWDKYFGTLNLTPTFLEKLLSFVDDGISEDVIVEVMKISSKKASGNPTNYIISLLRDYLNRSIYTVHDFKEEKQRMEEYEKRLQEINRKKEKRDEEETLEDYYKKGYR
ncbi:MAG: DnaD domain protein [Bacillota bacterium]